MTEIDIGQDKEATYTARAQEMWGRALIIVGNESKRGVALAVISAHLAEFGNIPQDFLVGTVFDGLVRAYRGGPQMICKTRIAKDLLIESGILRVSESEEYQTLGKGVIGE